MNKLCDEGLMLSEHTGLLAVYGIKTLVCFLGLFLLVYVYIYQNPTKSFHINSQIIFQFHCCFVVAGIVGTSLSDGFDLMRFTVVKAIRAANPQFEDCLVPPMSPYVGVALKSIKVFGNNGVVYTTTALAIERIVSSLQLESYEQKNSILGWTLSAISLMASGVLVAIRVGLADYSKDLSITSFTAAATGFSMRLQYSCAAVEVLTAFLLFVLLGLNIRRLKRRERIVNSLAYKAQIRENVSATALAFPLAFLHFVVYLPTGVVMPTWALSKTDLSERMQAVAMSDFMPLYFAFFPLVLWWRNRAKKVNIANLFVNNLIRTGDTKGEKDGLETAKYFEILNKMLK
ncbi:hypothetical protein QR680_011000 [Steinernema hermaphroditum]|uniref:Uncharacterized protein n=1 Tax=Steinernema hermaphroditum TaxID=289476 RepID=A0AA39IQS6_9BILA|nr:hypothetical protein QR680_011000 [Steinernema hermaphroditum]